MNSESTPLLELRQIVKQYPGCLANDHVDLRLQPGQVHALLGENGAGKSTLVKIVYGAVQADAGDILWCGKSVHVSSPAEARALGIAMVFQHFSLFDSLTVLENIALGLGVSESVRLTEQISEVSHHYGLPLDPSRYVDTLSVGERQRIEIVRCLLQKPRLLIMDEPTSVLTPQEVDQLFVTLRRLASEGLSILYISHKLAEIKSLCDQATILRAGRCVARANPQQETAESLAAMMIGSEVQPPRRSAMSQTNRVLLSMHELDLPAQNAHQVPLRSISLKLHGGEILGIAGVAGNGQDELLNAVSGEVLLPSTDMLKLDGTAIGHETPRQRRRAGMCCVPEQRLGHAAVPEMSLTENAFLTTRYRRRLSQTGWLKHRASKQFAQRVIDTFDVQCRGVDAAANSLSGGKLMQVLPLRSTMPYWR